MYHHTTTPTPQTTHYDDPETGIRGMGNCRIVLVETTSSHTFHSGYKQSSPSGDQGNDHISRRARSVGATGLYVFKRRFCNLGTDVLVTSAEFPFDFATLPNSAEWLAQGLEWMNAIPAPTALNPMTMIGNGNGNGIRNGLLPPLLPTPTPLPLPMPMPTRPQLLAPGQVIVPQIPNGATMTPILGIDNGLPADLPTDTGQLGETIWM